MYVPETLARSHDSDLAAALSALSLSKHLDLLLIPFFEGSASEDTKARVRIHHGPLQQGQGSSSGRALDQVTHTQD